MADRLTVALSVDALGPRLTGIGRYCLELARRLPEKLGRENLSYFRGEHWISDPQELLQQDWRPTRQSKWKRRYDNWRRTQELRQTVVHAPNYFLPSWAEIGVATIHDLSVFLYPETHPAERVKAFEMEFERTLQRASMLITDTETVRQELISIFGVAPERIRAVSLGIPHITAELDHSSLDDLDLRNGGYVLCVSTFEPRKRIDRLVEAYVRLPVATRQRFPLVLAGASGWHNEDINALIDNASRDGTVRRLGFVSEETLATLYGGAALFIYPSRYEGFGLPVVEAMAHGVPCIISNAPCLVEVAGGAAQIVEAENIDDFSDAILDALENTNWRRTASSTGKAVATRYSWDDCATSMVDIYRQVSTDRLLA